MIHPDNLSGSCLPNWHNSGGIASTFVPFQHVAKSDAKNDCVPVDLAKRIGANIKAVRERKGWTLEKVAKRCDPPTAYTSIMRLEKGERRLTLDWLERIAKALEVDPIDLVAKSEPPLRQMSEQVAAEMARILGRVALGGSEPDPDNVQVLSLMLQELSETFSRHPQAFADLDVARPVLDLSARRSSLAAS